MKTKKSLVRLCNGDLLMREVQTRAWYSAHYQEVAWWYQAAGEERPARITGVKHQSWRGSCGCLVREANHPRDHYHIYSRSAWELLCGIIGDWSPHAWDGGRFGQIGRP